MSVAVSKLGESIGVEIAGMSGRELVDAQAADMTKELLGQHGVVVYREVHIDDDDLLAFTRLLGTPVVQPTGEHRLPRDPDDHQRSGEDEQGHGGVPEGELRLAHRRSHERRTAEGDAAQCP